MFAIACEREDVSPEEEQLELPFDIATVGLIRVSKENTDGTSFVLLRVWSEYALFLSNKKYRIE